MRRTRPVQKEVQPAMTFEQIMAQEKFIPNEEQRPVMEAVCNTVVSAGAGAGKTAVLAWRFLRLVMKRGVKPEEILTLTFTKKAASEMRERIYGLLIKAKDSLPEDTLKSFGKASIATLDSFCAQIVRSGSVSYGLPRDSANLSDNDFQSMVEMLSEKFLQAPENVQESRAISALFMPSAVMSSFFMPVAASISITGNYEAEKVREAFLNEIRKIYKKEREELEPMFRNLGELNLSEKFMAQYENMFECYEKECFTDSDYFRLTGVRDPEIKEIVEEMKPIIGKGTGFVSLQNLANGTVDVPVLQKAVEKFANMLNMEKRSQGALTFRDVSDLAVVILRDNLYLRNVYKNRFKFIMIDEFQDNNILQKELLFLLSEKKSLNGTSGRVPTVDELEGEKLFFVGDEKQSIYKFRGADVSVFRKLHEEICKNGKALTLSINYRSNEKLIRHFNNVFKHVLYDDEKDFSARFSEMASGRGKDKTESKIIFAFYKNEKPAEDEQNSDEDFDGAVLEAEAIGNYCRRILTTDEFLVDGKRPEPNDIAILFRTTSNQMNIEKALKKRNIDYQTAEARDLMLDAVSNDFYCFINCLLYPEDRRSFVGLLKSPFCGLCEESMQNLLLKNGQVLEVDKTRYSAFLSFFEEVKEKAFSLTISQLLEILYIDGGYKAYLNSNEERRIYTEHYEYLYSYAVQYEHGGLGISDFARFLRNSLGSSGKLPDVSVLHREKNGVQIMTVHKSKGLEFKVVIFANIGSGNKNNNNRTVFEYKGLLLASEDKNIQKFLEQDRNEREQAERKRVMYVAMTRAREHLILIGGCRQTKDGGIKSGDIFKWYADAIDFDIETGECGDPDVTVENAGKTPDEPWRSTKNTSWRKAVENAVFKNFDITPSRIGVTELERLIKKNDVPKTGEILPVFEADSIIETLNLHDKFGTLCHLVLESEMRFGNSGDIVCTLCEREKDNEKLLSQARKFARGFRESTFFKKFIDGRRTHEELRFYTPFDADFDTVKEFCVEGVIDLIAEGEAFNLVVDYKTDSVRNPDEHKLQVQTYVRVAEEIFGKKCYGTLFYLRDGRACGFWDRDGNNAEL